MATSDRASNPPSEPPVPGSPPHDRPEAGAAARIRRALRPDAGWRGWVGTAAAVFLGALYLVAVYAKVIHPDAFADQIRLEGLDFLVPAGALAMIALTLEGALGVALLTNLRRLWVLIPTALLTVFFLGLNFRAWWLTSRGLREDTAGCGCFGNLVDRTPTEALFQDLLLLGIPTVLVFVGRPRSGRLFPPVRTALVAVAAVVVPVVAGLAPDLPLDDLATRLRPGVELSALCAGRDAERICLDVLVPELAQGEHLVVLADLEGEDFLAGVDALNDYAVASRGQGGAPVWVLAGGTPEEHRAFFWQHGPVFEVREVPEAVLAPLYRRLPRSFRVEDGRVVETWAGLPAAVVAEPGTESLHRSR